MSELLQPRPLPDPVPAAPGTWQQRLFIQFTRPDHGHLVALVEGEIDLSNADDLVGLIAGQAVGQDDLAVDLSGVDFLDTAAATALLDLHDGLGAQGTAMRVLVATPRVLRPLALLGLLDRLSVECRARSAPPYGPDDRLVW